MAIPSEVIGGLATVRWPSESSDADGALERIVVIHVMVFPRVV